jgi:hypothetical protein
MIARELPPDEVLASWQHVEQRALDLRAAGVPGTLQELRVRAYMDLLQETDCRLLPGDPDLTGAGGAEGATGPKRPDGPDASQGNGDPGDPYGGPGEPGPLKPADQQATEFLPGAPRRAAGGPPPAATWSNSYLGRILGLQQFHEDPVFPAVRI